MQKWLLVHETEAGLVPPSFNGVGADHPLPSNVTEIASLETVPGATARQNDGSEQETGPVP